jgi:DNA damage-inducible protein 1
MELTFLTDLGQSFVVEIDPNMELENVMALLEAEVSNRQVFRFRRCDG